MPIPVPALMSANKSSPCVCQKAFWGANPPAVLPALRRMQRLLVDVLRGTEHSTVDLAALGSALKQRDPQAQDVLPRPHPRHGTEVVVGFELHTLRFFVWWEFGEIAFFTWGVHFGGLHICAGEPNFPGLLSFSTFVPMYCYHSALCWDSFPGGGVGAYSRGACIIWSGFG